MFDIEHETRVSVHKTMSSTKRFTGASILHKYLYPLYGFDILKYMVFEEIQGLQKCAQYRSII